MSEAIKTINIVQIESLNNEPFDPSMVRFAPPELGDEVEFTYDSMRGIRKRGEVIEVYPDLRQVEVDTTGY